MRQLLFCVIWLLIPCFAASESTYEQHQEEKAKQYIGKTYWVCEGYSKFKPTPDTKTNEYLPISQPALSFTVEEVILPPHRDISSKILKLKFENGYTGYVSLASFEIMPIFSGKASEDCHVPGKDSYIFEASPVQNEEACRQAKEAQKAKKRASARKSFNTLGFKGIHLGMTAEELDIYMEDAPEWGYTYDDSAIDKDHIFIKGYVSDPDKDQDPAQIGCDGAGECYPLDDIYVQLFNSKAISVILPSPKYSADYIDANIKKWGRFALKGLIKKYGQPTKTYITFEKVNIFTFKSGFNIYLYEWKKGKERVLLTTSVSEAEFGINVVFEDMDGMKKYQKQKEQSKTEF